MTEPEKIQAKPKISWWVYVGGRDGIPWERIRHQATMRGWVAWDATCTCGWDSQTGGAVRSYVEREVWTHKHFDHEQPKEVR